jgi:hypothetical protein
LRTTAFPILELTVTPKRVSARSVAWVMTTKFAVCSFFPERDRLVNSGRFLRRASFGNLAPTLLPIGRAYGSGSGSFRRYRHRQFLPSFGPAAAQNVSTSGRFHSGQKSVRPFTFYVAGLIGSFHFRFAPYAESLLSVGFPYVKTSGGVFPDLGSGIANLTPFGFEGPKHQIAYAFRRFLTFIDHSIHLLDDRHLDAQA